MLLNKKKCIRNKLGSRLISQKNSDQYQTLKKNPDPDQTLKKNLDPYSGKKGQFKIITGSGSNQSRKKMNTVLETDRPGS